MKDKLDMSVFQRLSFPVLEKIDVKLRGPSSTKSRMGKWHVLAFSRLASFGVWGLVSILFCPGARFSKVPVTFRAENTHSNRNIKNKSAGPS